MEEKNNGISDSRYKSRFFKKLAAWMGKHGAALTAVVLIAVSAILGCAEATIIYAAKGNGASNDYGTSGNTSSPSYIGGSGNNPTVYEPGVIGVSVVTYDLNEVNKKGTLYYGGDKNKPVPNSSPVASTNDPEVVKAAKEEYEKSGKAPKDQLDYYPYWIDKMGTTDKGKTIYKYSNSLHHAITSNILAMQNSYEYDDSTLVFVPRVVASSSHHSWLKNEKQSVVTGRAKGNKKSVFYDLDPWYEEKDAGSFKKTSKGVTDGVAGSGKNKAGIYYADLKKYIKNKEKKSSKNKKSFVEVTSVDSKKKYEVCNYAHFSELSKDDINKIIGFNGKSFSSKGKTNLARARRLYSSIANVNETSKGQYTTTPEMADIFLRYTTAAGLSSKSYGTEMFSKNGTKEGLYGTQKGVRDAANKNMVGSQVLRSIYQANSRFKKVLAPGATREMDDVKKRVLNDEYNTHYLDLLVSGYALAQSSGDKKAANEWLKAVTTYAKTAADGSNGKGGSSSLENVVIRLDMGMVYATSKEVTYASCGSVINKHYNFSGKADAFASLKSVNAKSLNKGFIGFTAADDKSGQNYQAHNGEVATKKGVVSKSKYKDADYGTYYDRLSKAVQNTKSVTGSGKDWYSHMVIMRTTKAYYSMPNKNGKPNARVYNRLATVELLQTVGSQQGINVFKGTAKNIAWQYGTYAVDGYYWTSTQPEETPDVKLNLTIYSKDVNGKEPAQNGKDIKDTFQSYSMTGKTHTATIKDNLYVKLSPGKDQESKKLFDKVLASDKYHVKIVFENADGTTAASLLDPKIVKSVQQVTDPETGTKYDAKKEVTYYKALNAYDSTNKGSEKGDEQNYNKLVSAKQIGGKDLQANRSLIWRISNADVRTKGFKISGTGSYYVNWKAKVYIMQKSGSGAKTKWTSVINGSSVKKTKPSMSDLKAGGCATTNNVIAQYIYHKDDTKDVNLSDTYESIPEAYAELKEGSIYNETFEAMAGVPSTRSLYFATGGSEFIVNMQAVYDDYYLKEISGGSKNSYRSTRRYKSVFNSTDCEYKKGDTLKSLTAGNTKEETFVADANDRKQEKSVTAEKNSAVNPQGAAGYNTTVNGHDSTTKFHATWTGTIGNNTSRWSQSGSNVSPSGKPCEGGNAGEVYSMSPTPANWDVSAYNTALGQAANWAKKMEQIGKSADGTVYRIDDSDGYKRVYHVGTATIKVTLTGGEKSYDTGSSRSYGGGTYTSSDLVSSAKRTNTSADLGTGWSYTKGNKASASGSHTTDEHGKVTGHSSWSGYKGSVDGKSSSIQYKIEVTFKDGSITAGNYDGKVGESGLKVEKKSGLTQFGAHDLCGACCQHVLPAIEDTWIQKLRFDTIRFTNLKVWKLQEGYAEGMGEIRKTDDGSGSSIEGEAGKAEADAVKKEKEDNKDNTQVVDPDLSDVEGTEAANDKEYDENGDLIVPDYETGDIGDDPDADGEETWTDTSENDLDIVKSKIVRYDPNIFYNIAQADTSKAGRIRYSLQTGQDDDVTWTEFNSDKKLTRTDSCDGQTASHGGSPVVVTANGHKKSWCRGCLYTNSTYSNLRNRHDNAKTSGKEKGEAGEAAKTKTGYTDNTADAVDKTTFEWKRFDKRRKLNCKATVISDFLILQTSSGNESIVYYQDTAETKHHECQENYEDTLWYSKPADMNNLKKENVSKAKWMWEDKMWTNNPLVKKTSNLNVGSYNGNYSSTSTKYQGTGGNAVVETAFDKDEEKYNHITDTDENGNTLDLAKVTSARTIETKQKQMDDVKTIMQTKSDSIDGNICSPGCGNTYGGTNYDTYGSGSARMGTNTADVYTAPTKQDVWGKYSWINRILPSLNGQTDAPEPAQFGNAGLVLMQDGIAQCPTNPNQEYVTGQSHAFFIPLVTYTNFGADKNAETHDITNYTFKYTDKNDSVAGRVGYTMDSIYTNGQTKVNNIVVHDPVSVQGANILTVNKEMDQRVLGDDKSGAAEMNKEANDVTCPGTAEECQYRLLNCQYGKPVRRAAFNVDNAKHSDVEDDDGVVHSYDSIISNILAPGGTYMDVSLADSGFSIKRYDGLGAFEGTSEDDRNQPDRYLSGNGSASLAMSWSAMGVDTEEAKSDTYELQGVFNFHNALDSEKALFTTRATKLLAEPDGSLKIVLADGSEYTSAASLLAKDGKNAIQYHFGMDSVMLSPKKVDYKGGSYTVDANTGVIVDGKEISFTKTKNPSGDMTNYIGDGIWFGNQDDAVSDGTAYNSVYDCSYSLDNLAVTRLAPEKDANGISYRHTLSCFAGVTEHAKTTQDYYNGISDKKVQYTYNYTGDVQTFTAPADGVYTLEAWGASGGDGYDDSVDRETTSSVAGNGGYSKGNISLKKGQKIYVFVGGAGKYGAGTNRFGGPAGGYNGGGDGGVADSGSGGGMSHISTTNNPATTSWNPDGTLLAAGGGAGGSGYTASGLTNTEMKSGVRRGNGLVKITAAGTIDWTRKFDDGYQKQTSENNRHVHTEACVDTPSEGFKIAVDEASNGNTADLGKMLGSAVWGKIKDQLKNCYGSGSGGSAGSVAAGKTYTYDYSGSVKSVTLPAGKYKLEAWGASGGGRNPGKGGYSAGTVTFANETTVYIVAGQSAGTYNGGGIGCHGYGGGATHFATANGELAALSNNKNSVLLVAGGGAGGSSGAGGAGGGANQSGTTGGNGCGTKGEGATVSGPGNAYFSGSFGKGGSNSGWNTCGGGGGLYGGGGSYESYSRNDDDDAGAGGGSGFASPSLTDVSGITGEHSGNGYAKITVIEAHTDYDPDKVFDLVKKATGNNYSLIPDSVTTDGHTIINPFWSCQCIYDSHVCTKHCKTTYVLQCKEPHHKAVNGKIGHYDAGNEICYDACHNDELHKKGAEQANAGKPGTSKPLKFGDFVLLDNYFYIYFPNSGDFYESDDYGIAQTEQRKGKGYANNYDCTEWTREKWIKFPFSVLYNRNGTFEEHPAGQWFQLEITDKVTNRNVKNNCYDLTSLSERDDGFTYQFYAQLDNHEMSGATIEYAVEAINNQPSPSGSENPYDRDGALSLDCSQDNSSITNAERAIDLTAKHSAYKQTFVDLISRIGNLTVQDSTDLRFSNLFKRKTNDDKWYIDGIVHAVDKSIQNAYLSWHKNNGDTATDIRGEKVSAYNQWYNTWHTAKWSDVGEDSSRCVSTPLESAKNNIAALRGKSEQLQLGYNLLWDIQVLSRDFADGNVQIEPKYYILDTKKDKLMAVDVWGSRNEDVTLVNEFGLMDKYGTDYFNQQKDKIYDHAMLLNWDDEKARRNYSDEEKAATETASKVLGRTILDANGMPMTQKNPLTGMEEEVVAPLSIPMGDGYREGNAQFLYLNGRTRTFIGNSKVTALHKDINGDDDQELFKEFDAIGNDLGPNGVSEDEYSFCASRWHVTLGLPSSAKFTDVTVDKDGKEQHINPYDMITDEDTGDKIYAYQKYDPDYLKEHGDENRYMILETARITAYGAVYNLRYSQLMDNGSITAANGKTYNFVDSATYPGKANSIPTLLAVYGITNSGRDYETLQTH